MTTKKTSKRTSKKTAPAATANDDTTKKKAKKATKKTATKKKTAAKKKTTKKKATVKAPQPPAVLLDPQGGVRVEREIGGRMLSLETGRMAKQADGAVVARYGDTMVLATAQSAQAREDLDFFPLTVDYRERAAAAGKIPGGFFKREGRPSSKEILTSRIIDRSIRPLFPEGFRKEVQVLSLVLCSDLENESDIVAAIASFAALAISSIPHEKVLGACRIGLVGDELLINPTWPIVQSEDNKLNLTVAAHEDAVVMVEAAAREVPEDVMLEALELGHRVCVDVAELVQELVEKAGKPKQEFEPPVRQEDLDAAIARKFGKQLAAAPTQGRTKEERKASKDSIKEQVLEAFPAPEDASDKEVKAHEKYVAKVADELMSAGERQAILSGRRADGRDEETIRPITVDVGVLPRVHGSALFTRGETQALVVCTLGTADDQQIIDGIYPEPSKRFLLHYNFPPFSVGEVKRFGFVGRREIGHGALAERALDPVLPPESDFPYTIRITSEILESNGSSSMATVCGATLALMDAGVPIRQPVAGIAMGLVMEGEDVAILSDILGSEDHVGDMDFKVAGTGKGITALQMDIKCEGLSREILEQALEQARRGRLHILREMLSVIRSPRADISPNAPRLVSFQIPVERIGVVIGPGGQTIRKMQEEFDAKIHIENDGRVTVAGTNLPKVDACVQRIKDMTAEVEVGATYKGRVTAIKEFGAFIEILPGQEGMCHVSELSNDFIRSVTDVVRIGDEVDVKVVDIDDFGKIRLSRKALLEGGESDEGAQDTGREARGPRGDSRERRERGGRDRGGRRGGRDDRDDRDGDRDRDRGRGSSRRRERVAAEPDDVGGLEAPEEFLDEDEPIAVAAEDPRGEQERRDDGERRRRRRPRRRRRE